MDPGSAAGPRRHSVRARAPARAPRRVWVFWLRGAGVRRGRLEQEAESSSHICRCGAREPPAAPAARAQQRSSAAAHDLEEAARKLASCPICAQMFDVHICNIINK